MHPDVHAIGDLHPRQRPLLLAAFDASSGGVAAATIAYLARHWGAAAVAEIEPDRHFDFTVQRPLVRREAGRRVIDWPEARFWVARPEGADRDIVLFVGAEPHLRWGAYMAAFAAVAEALGVERTVIVNAYPGGAAHTRPIPMHLVGADDLAVGEFGLPSRGPRYQGPASFAMAIAAEERGRARGGVSLTAIAPFYVPGEANPYAVRALVAAIDRAVGSRTDLAELDGRVAEADIALIDVFEAQPEVERVLRELEREYDAAEPPRAAETEEPVDPEAVVDGVESFLRGLRERSAPGGDPDGGAPEAGDGRRS